MLGGLKLIVGGLKLLLDGLKLFLGGLKLLLGGLKLLFGGIELFSGSFELLFCGVKLFLGGLKVRLGDVKLLLGGLKLLSGDIQLLLLLFIRVLKRQISLHNVFLLICCHVIFHVFTCYLLSAASILEWAVERLQWTRAAVIRHGSTSDTSHTTPVGAVQRVTLILQVSLEVLAPHYLLTPLIGAGDLHIATPLV